MLDAAREQRFDAIYAELRSSLFAFFLARCGARDRALDLLQETFVRVWRNLDSLQTLPPDRARAWVFTVARNLVVDDFRARTARERAEAAAAVEPPSQWAPAPEAAAISSDLQRTLDEAIRQLPDDLRLPLVLSVLAQRTSTEIGELLGRPPGTVRYQLSEARRRLAAQLNQAELTSTHEPR